MFLCFLFQNSVVHSVTVSKNDFFGSTEETVAVGLVVELDELGWLVYKTDSVLIDTLLTDSVLSYSMSTESVVTSEWVSEVISFDLLLVVSDDSSCFTLFSQDLSFGSNIKFGNIYVNIRRWV